MRPTLSSLARSSASILLASGILLVQIPTDALAQAAPTAQAPPAAAPSFPAGKWPDMLKAAAKKYPKGFKLALCSGDVLELNEPSPPCHMTGGHQAPYAFNTGNTFLPPGVTLDGYNGVLTVTDPAALSTRSFKICVIQLNETLSCPKFGNGPFPEELPPMEPAAKAHGGHGGAMLAAAALGLAGAVAVAAAVGGASGSGGGGAGAGAKSCPVEDTYATCCPSGPGPLCGISPMLQSEGCACPSGTSNNGTCQAGQPCNTLGGFAPGTQLCGC